MTPIITAIEKLWFEPGTAADAALAVNAYRGRVKHVSPDWVRKQWKALQDMGRLPPFERPANGFPPGPASILREFMKVQREKAA